LAKQTPHRIDLGDFSSRFVGSEAAAVGIEPSVVVKAARWFWAWLRGRTALQVVALTGAASVVIAGGALATIAYRDYQEQVAANAEAARVARLSAARGGILNLSTPINERWATPVFPSGRQSLLWEGTGWVTSASETLSECENSLGELGVADELGNPPEMHGFLRWHSVLADDIAVFITDIWRQTCNWDESWGLYAAWPEVVQQLVIAVDARSGSEVWRHYLDGDVNCGWSALWDGASGSIIRRERVVCFGGASGDATEVTVIEADGTIISTRRTGSVNEPAFTIGADGLLWRAELAKDAPPRSALSGPSADETMLFTVSPGGGGVASSGVVIQDQRPHRLEPVDVLVIVEDPLTGEEVWRKRIEASGGLFDRNCLASDWNPTGLGLVVRAATMVVWGCGIEATLSLAGNIITDQTDHPFGTWGYGLWPLPDGGFAFVSDPSPGMTQSWAEYTTILDETGERITRLPGGYLNIMATDGHTENLFTTDGYEVHAWTPGGEPLWRAEVPFQVRWPLALADGVLVLIGVSDTRQPMMMALREATGEIRWSYVGGDGINLRPMTAHQAPLAWTDGEVLVLAYGVDSGQWGAAEWAAFCLQTGEPLWHLDREASRKLPLPSRCIAVNGSLLCAAGDTIIRLA